MKTIIAMDSFKGSMTSNELNDVIGSRLEQEINNLELVKIPISDGGEGFLETYSYRDDFEEITTNVHGPLMKRLEAAYLFNKESETAIIESARIIGLDKVDELVPFKASSFGLGEVILDAANKGAKEIVVGLGGSATNDAGVGMLRALGYYFFDENDNTMDISISNIDNVHSIGLKNNQLKDIKFKAVTDVKNVFTGGNGATSVFGPQKGLLPNEIKKMDRKFEHFKNIIKKKTNIDLSSLEGAGAAGGISGVMNAYLNAELVSGIEYILDNVSFENHCKDTDFIITGEGRIDQQSFYGKVIQGISDIASSYRIPVIALGGGVDTKMLVKNDDVYPLIFSIMNKPISLEKAMEREQTIENLDFTVKNLTRLIQKFNL